MVAAFLRPICGRRNPFSVPGLIDLVKFDNVLAHQQGLLLRDAHCVRDRTKLVPIIAPHLARDHNCIGPIFPQDTNFSMQDTRSATLPTPRVVGEPRALPIIHAFQSAAPFDWLQGPQEGTRFLISLM